MAEQTRKSRFAVKEETTIGTSIAPTAGTDFLAQQEGFTLSPAFEELENAELTASIGRAKTILGIENPTAEISHYLRHSGVEATAPAFGLLLEASMGSETVRATERDVVSATAGTASAAATITVDTGEGTEFARGDLLLIKDGTNGFEMREVLSVAGDVLTLAWNLGTAPAAAVNLGRNVKYSPADSGHPSLSLWEYRANGADIEHIAGARVTTASIAVEAGQLINATYSLEGTEYKFNPLEVTATNNKLDITDDGGTFAVALSDLKIYKDPEELRSALETAINAAATDTFTVTYSDATPNASGKFTIASDGATLSLLWKTGASGADNTDEHIGTLLGYDDSADSTGATSYEAPNAISLASPFTPSFDVADPLVAKNNEVFLGDFADNVCFPVQSMSFEITDNLQPVNDVCAVSGQSEKIIDSREVTINIVATLTKFESDTFTRFRNNTETAFAFHFGEKSGGNWVAGKSGSLYVPTATIINREVTDTDGIVTVEMDLRAFVNSSGDGEVYINFV